MMSHAPVFPTKRLIVRRWCDADQPKILSLYRTPRVIRWVDDGTPLSADDAARWMQVTATNYATRGYGMYAIDSRETNQTIGFGGLVHPGGATMAEIKYAFDPGVWGRGLGTEFVSGLLTYAWAHLSHAHITATVAPENVASARVLVKCGFHRQPPRTEADGSQTDVYAIDRP